VEADDKEKKKITIIIILLLLLYNAPAIYNNVVRGRWKRRSCRFYMNIPFFIFSVIFPEI